jgi:hypothetical protein
MPLNKTDRPDDASRAMWQGDESLPARLDAVVNLVGILTETTTQTYRAIHVEGVRRVCAGSTAQWRDAPYIGPRRQPDVVGDLGPDKG